jgi:hypothetical protein
MNRYLGATVVTFSLLLAAQSCFAKEWRGIAPLRSTRADVVRLLNQCSEQKEACAFSLAQEEVYILFSGGLRDNEEECARRLPPETVMFIQVWPRPQPRLNDLHLDKKTLNTFGASALLDQSNKGFLAKEGLVIDTYRGRVLQLVYIADPSDVRLCPVIFEEPELFIQTLTVHPPLTISIDCPFEAAQGDKVVLRSSVGLDLRRGPRWTVNAGRIIAGQHTHKMTLDTTGLAGRTIVVTAEMNDGFGHLTSTSCQIVIVPG